MKNWWWPFGEDYSPRQYGIDLLKFFAAWGALTLFLWLLS